MLRGSLIEKRFSSYRTSTVTCSRSRTGSGLTRNESDWNERNWWRLRKPFDIRKIASGLPLNNSSFVKDTTRVEVGENPLIHLSCTLTMRSHECAGRSKSYFEQP